MQSKLAQNVAVILFQKKLGKIVAQKKTYGLFSIVDAILNIISTNFAFQNFGFRC